VAVPPEDSESPTPRPDEGTSTAEILVRAKRGDQLAQDALVRRHIKALMRQAHGRLPSKSRGMYDTEDLVQATFLRAFRNLGRIEPRERGYFLAYLRKIMNNLIRDAMRSAARRPRNEPIGEDLAAREPSPVDIAAIHEKLEAYHSALSELSREQQEVVRLRMELGMSYQEIADAVGAASANAVRMQVARAVAHVARQMLDLKGD
jgi:RNA polymerase sigma-70 factor (ECF subfamily)